MGRRNRDDRKGKEQEGVCRIKAYRECRGMAGARLSGEPNDWKNGETVMNHSDVEPELIEQFARHADEIDDFLEHLSLKHEVWILTGHGFDETTRKIVSEFISWCADEARRDLNAKRGGK